MFDAGTFEQLATLDVGRLPHGLWPSADGTRMYVGLENADALAVIDALEHRLLSTVPIGQAPQAVVYVPQAVPQATAGPICNHSASQPRRCN